MNQFRSNSNQQGIGLVAAMVGGSMFGLLIVIAALSLYSGQVSTQQVNAEPSIEYGRQLIRETSSTMGPNHENPSMRLSGTNLDCASCHLDTGTEPGTLSLLLADTKYPRFSGRDGVESDLRDRINGCMTRSMNGTELARDSIEMLSMEMYIKGLAQQYALMGDSKRALDEPPVFVEPNRMASIDAGAEVFRARCQVCHGEDGEGLLQTTDLVDGYLFPPLWGADSFNNGAGMTRILTAARFIKARMPLGQADLSDDEAYDVAAYMNSHERPRRANLEVDYPDISRKPVDSPYPPYGDNFSQEQHQLGPFEPIREYYRNIENEENL